MYTENIIRDIKYIIHDTRLMENSVNGDRKDAYRALSNASEEELWEETAKTYETGLIDAQNALQLAEEHLRKIQDRLDMIVEDIEREALSAKVQSK